MGERFQRPQRHLVKQFSDLLYHLTSTKVGTSPHSSILMSCLYIQECFILCFLFIHTHTYTCVYIYIYTQRTAVSLQCLKQTFLLPPRSDMLLSYKIYPPSSRGTAKALDSIGQQPTHSSTELRTKVSPDFIIQGTRCTFTTTCLLSPITYRPALSLQKQSLVLQKIYIVQSFILQI